MMLLLMLTLTTGVYSPLPPLTVPGLSVCFVLSFMKSSVKCKNSCENSILDISIYLELVGGNSDFRKAGLHF